MPACESLSHSRSTVVAESDVNHKQPPRHLPGQSFQSLAAGTGEPIPAGKRRSAGTTPLTDSQAEIRPAQGGLRLLQIH